MVEKHLVNQKIGVLAEFALGDVSYKQIRIIQISIKKHVQIEGVRRIWRVREGQRELYHFIVFSKFQTTFHLIFDPIVCEWHLESYEN